MMKASDKKINENNVPETNEKQNQKIWWDYQFLLSFYYVTLAWCTFSVCFFDIGGAFFTFIAYYDTCQHYPRRKWHEGGRNEHVERIRISQTYKLLFFQNKGIYI